MTDNKTFSYSDDNIGATTAFFQETEITRVSLKTFYQYETNDGKRSKAWSSEELFELLEDGFKFRLLKKAKALMA